MSETQPPAGPHAPNDPPRPAAPPPAAPDANDDVGVTPEPQSFTLQPRPSLLRFLTEHNPFYLLSAACMLASCLALTNTVAVGGTGHE